MIPIISWEWLFVFVNPLFQVVDLLAVDGRISVITFHSLEDRLTKQLFKEASTVDVPKGLPFIPEDLQPKVALVNRKPILPSQEELEANNRSHSRCV